MVVYLVSYPTAYTNACIVKMVYRSINLWNFWRIFYASDIFVISLVILLINFDTSITKMHDKSRHILKCVIPHHIFLHVYWKRKSHQKASQIICTYNESCIMTINVHVYNFMYTVEIRFHSMGVYDPISGAIRHIFIQTHYINICNLEKSTVNI